MPNTNSGYELTWPAENIDQQLLKIPGLEAKIGDLSTLTTEQKANLVAAINELVASVATKTKNSNISASFDTTKVYSAGDYAIHDGDLYRAKEDISAGAWDESKWTLISIGEDLAKKANVDGNYEGLTSGFANNLTPYSADDGVIQEAAFISQGTGTGNNLVSVDTSTVAQLLEKSGNSVVINQPIKNGNFATTDMWNPVGGTFSVANNIGTFTPSQQNAWLLQNVAIANGHKYLAHISVKLTSTTNADKISVDLRDGTSAKLVGKAQATTNWQEIMAVIDAVNSIDSGYLRLIDSRESDWNAIQVSNAFIFDITSWPAEIIADLTANPSHFSWYYNGSLAYNPGSLENSTGRYLVCTKRNLWDEQWEYGRYGTSTGAPEPSSDSIRSKNFTLCTPNVKYYGYIPESYSSVYALCIFFYDAQKNFISSSYYIKNGAVTAPANARYFNISTNFYGNTYHNDITISLYYSPEQGGEGYDQHYPYEEPFVCDTGDEALKSAGSAKDTKAPSGLITGNIGSGVISAANTFDIMSQYGIFAVTELDMEAPVTADDRRDGVASDRFVPATLVSVDSNMSDMSCLRWAGAGTKRVVFRDSSCTSVSDFVTKYNGMKYQYKLETPTATQSTSYNPNLTVDDYGMMYWLDTNGNLVSVPQPCKVSYNTDYKGSLDTLIKHANGDMTDVALNSEMEEALSNKASIADLENGNLVPLLADKLTPLSDESGATQTEPFFFQATATANNTAETPTPSPFYLKGVRGNTIVYNQLVNTGDTEVSTISGHKYWTSIDGTVAIVTADGTAIALDSDADKVVDFTRWFNGSIPQAILDDATVFPINYYDDDLTYSAGELKNCSCTELKTVGFNALKTQPTILSNMPAFDASIVTRVLPGITYHLKYTATGTGRVYVISYDLNGNLLGKKNVDGSAFYYNSTGYDMYGNDINREENIKFLYPSYILIFYSAFGSFTDCNLNLKWDGERDGEYSPYISHTYPMVWSGKSAGSAYDEKLPDGTEITRIGEYTFTGSETMLKRDTGTNCDYYQIANALAGNPSVNDFIGAKTSAYGLVGGNAYSLNVPFLIETHNTYIFFTIPIGDDPADYIHAGDKVVYALATPTTSSGDAFTSVIEGDDYGTMSFDSVVPVGNEFFYPADYKGIVDDLYNYTGGDASALALKSEVGGKKYMHRLHFHQNETNKIIEGYISFIDDSPTAYRTSSALKTALSNNFPNTSTVENMVGNYMATGYVKLSTVTPNITMYISSFVYLTNSSSIRFCGWDYVRNVKDSVDCALSNIYKDEVIAI